VDGFVLSGLGYEDPRVRVIRQLNMPVVAFGRTDSTPESTDTICPYVDVDGQRGMYQAVQHLISLGHARIGVLAWPTSSRVGEERLAGYLQAMDEAGLAVDPDWIIRGEGEFDYGYQAAPVMLDLPPSRRPTAFATMMDLIGIGVIRAIEERGLVVGREVGVTGFDDQPVVRYFKPGLTTLRQPIWEVGQQTIRLLVDLVQGNPVPSHKILLEPELILRESTRQG